MSIKLQKSIRFVPIVNVFVTGFSLIKVWSSIPKLLIAAKFKFTFLVFVSMILVNIPQIILLEFSINPILSTTISLVSSYVTLFVISTLAIIQQEKYVSNDDK